MQSIEQKVFSRILWKGPGYVFTPGDFLDLANRNAVGQILFRAVRAGRIRKLARGLFDFPARHPRLGVLTPPMDHVAIALKGREASRLQPSGAHAANLLGLSDQVPVKMVFFTDGRSRKIRIGKREVVLKKTTPRQMATAGRASGTVIQALRWLGRQNVDDKIVNILRRQLSSRDKRQLLDDMRYAPAWIGDVMRRVSGRSSS